LGGRVAVKTGVLVLLLVGLVVLAVVGVQDARHAHAVFSGKVDYEEVLATRRWHAPAEGFGCSYAVVSLKESAGRLPPGTWLGDEPWMPSPVRIASPTHLTYPGNAVSVCAAKGHFSPDVADRLQRALIEPGSYYLHLGESVFLYSAPLRIAAVVRYGD
jgi:hypothetical protein